MMQGEVDLMVYFPFRDLLDMAQYAKSCELDAYSRWGRDSVERRLWEVRLKAVSVELERRWKVLEGVGDDR